MPDAFTEAPDVRPGPGGDQTRRFDTHEDLRGALDAEPGRRPVSETFPTPQQRPAADPARLTRMPPGEAQGEIERAVNAQTTRDQLAPFRGRGRVGLGLLEEQGRLSAEQGRSLAGAATDAVNDATARAAPNAIRSFQAETGVQVREVLVGDSGSSAGSGSGVRSAISDNDRTTLPVYEAESFQRYARQHHGGDARAAREALDRLYARQHHLALDAELQHRYSVTSDDLDCSTYAGLGGTKVSGGKLDEYPAGTTNVRQSVRGGVTVVRPDGGSYRTSGDAIIDQQYSHRARDGAGPAAPFADPRYIDAEDSRHVLREQATRAGELDPANLSRPQIQDGAKSVLRAADAGRRLGATPLDPDLVDLAGRLRQDPANASAILARAGMTREQFLRRVQSEVTAYGRRCAPGP
jgi:hypothetical protein